MILHLKYSIIQITYKPILLTLHITNNLCLHNLEIQIMKINLHTKNIVPIVIEQTTPSLLVSKNNEMMKIKDMLMLDRNLLKNHSYSTFVLPQLIEQKDMIDAIEVEVVHGPINTTKRLIHKTDIALHPEIALVMTKTLFLHNSLDHDMTRFTILSLALQIFLQIPLQSCLSS